MGRWRWARWCVAIGMVVALAVLAGCGAAATSTSNGSAGPAHQPVGSGGQSIYAPAATAAPGQTPGAGPQYLIKSLAVSMMFSDTRKVASDLQTWMATADPQSTSAGSDYEQVGTDNYRITVTFSVAATAYPHVFSYLAAYAKTHDGHLESLQETVQDVTNDYVDSNSRLKNLRAEQDRLLALMNQATSLNDTLTIEQRLTDVEGQIEQIEAHLNSLNGQTTFYKVTVTLDPVGSPTPIQPNSAWNPGQTIHDAFVAALNFGEGLVSLLIWLAFFAVYLVPVVVIILLIRRFMRARAARRPAPTMAPATVAAPFAPAAPTAPARPMAPPTPSQPE